MLKNLLKYDLKWIYKVILIFYVLAFIFSIIGRCLVSIDNSLVLNIVGQISLGFAVGMMISSLINCIMRSWIRFIRNLYKDESYLTHTLPIEKKTIYKAKILSSVIATLTTMIVIVICLFICYYSQSNIEILRESLSLAATAYDTTVVNLLIIMFLILSLEIVFAIVIGYIGIIIGHKSNKNKMLRTIVISFVLYMGCQSFSLIMIYVFGIFNPSVMNLINTTASVDVDAIKSILYMAIALYTIYIISLYIVGYKKLENGVDVD